MDLQGFPYNSYQTNTLEIGNNSCSSARVAESDKNADRLESWRHGCTWVEHARPAANALAEHSVHDAKAVKTRSRIGREDERDETTHGHSCSLGTAEGTRLARPSQGNGFPDTRLKSTNHGRAPLDSSARESATITKRSSVAYSLAHRRVHHT